MDWIPNYPPLSETAAMIDIGSMERPAVFRMMSVARRCTSGAGRLFDRELSRNPFIVRKRGSEQTDYSDLQKYKLSDM